MRRIALALFGCLTFLGCEPALAATYVLDLGWKELSFTNQMALGEAATVELRGIGTADPTNLTLYLSNKAGDMLAITEGMAATGSYATAELLLTSTNLLEEFDGVSMQGSRAFDLSVWDSARSVLLASAPVWVRNNPLWETLAFTNLPAIDSLGLAEYLSRSYDWTNATATARYTLDLGWKDLVFENSMAVAERAVVEIRGIGTAEPAGILLYLSNRDGEGLALASYMVAGTNDGSAIGMLNLATTNLLAEFDGLRPLAEKSFDLSVWDSGRDVLLGSAAVVVRNNPLAAQFTAGWTNLPETVETEVLASVADAVARATAAQAEAAEALAGLADAETVLNDATGRLAAAEADIDALQAATVSTNEWAADYAVLLATNLFTFEYAAGISSQLVDHVASTNAHGLDGLWPRMAAAESGVATNAAGLASLTGRVGVVEAGLAAIPSFPTNAATTAQVAVVQSNLTAHMEDDDSHGLDNVRDSAFAAELLSLTNAAGLASLTGRVGAVEADILDLVPRADTNGWEVGPHLAWLTTETDAAALAAMGGYAKTNWKATYTNYLYWRETEIWTNSWDFMSNGVVKFSGTTITSSTDGVTTFIPDSKINIHGDFEIYGMNPIVESELFLFNELRQLIANDGTTNYFTSYYPQFGGGSWSWSGMVETNGAVCFVDTNSVMVITNTGNRIFSAIEAEYTNSTGQVLGEVSFYVNGALDGSLFPPVDSTRARHYLSTWVYPGDVLEIRWTQFMPPIPYGTPEPPWVWLEPYTPVLDTYVQNKGLVTLGLSDTNAYGNIHDTHGKILLVDTPDEDADERQVANVEHVENRLGWLGEIVDTILPSENGVRLNGNAIEFGEYFKVIEEGEELVFYFGNIPAFSITGIGAVQIPVIKSLERLDDDEAESWMIRMIATARTNGTYTAEWSTNMATWARVDVGDIVSQWVTNDTQVGILFPNPDPEMDNVMWRMVSTVAATNQAKIRSLAIPVKGSGDEPLATEAWVSGTVATGAYALATNAWEAATNAQRFATNAFLLATNHEERITELEESAGGSGFPLATNGNLAGFSLTNGTFAGTHTGDGSGLTGVVATVTNATLLTSNGVAITEAAIGAGLDWDGTTLTATAVGGGTVTNLADLADVDATAPATNQVLTWNGSSWTNATPAAGSASTSGVRTPYVIAYTTNLITIDPTNGYDQALYMTGTGIISCVVGTTSTVSNVRLDLFSGTNAVTITSPALASGTLSTSAVNVLLYNKTAWATSATVRLLP